VRLSLLSAGSSGGGGALRRIRTESKVSALWSKLPFGPGGGLLPTAPNSPFGAHMGGEAGKASPTGMAGLSLQQWCKMTSTSDGIISRLPEGKDRKRRKIQQHGMKGIYGTENRKTACRLPGVSYIVI
jgi:hypothetical protein